MEHRPDWNNWFDPTVLRFNILLKFDLVDLLSPWALVRLHRTTWFANLNIFTRHILIQWRDKHRRVATPLQNLPDRQQRICFFLRSMILPKRGQLLWIIILTLIWWQTPLRLTSGCKRRVNGQSAAADQHPLLTTMTIEGPRLYNPDTARLHTHALARTHTTNQCNAGHSCSSNQFLEPQQLLHSPKAGIDWYKRTCDYTVRTPKLYTNNQTRRQQATKQKK